MINKYKLGKKVKYKLNKYNSQGARIQTITKEGYINRVEISLNTNPLYRVEEDLNRWFSPFDLVDEIDILEEL